MKAKLISLISLLIVLLVTCSLPVYAQEQEKKPIYVTVLTLFEDGRPAPSVSVSFDGKEQLTDAEGRTVFKAAPGAHNVTAVYGRWSSSLTLTLSENSTLVFAVRPPTFKPPTIVYTLPLNLLLWTPGGFIITFDSASHIEAKVVSSTTEKYVLEIRNNIVTFTSNVSGVFDVEVYVKYANEAWYSGSIITYSESALVRTQQSFTFYGSELTVKARVEAQVGPHYPTPDEIARAQNTYLEDTAKRIVDEVAKYYHRNYLEMKELEKSVEELTRGVRGSADTLSALVGDFRDTIMSFQANAWAAIGIFAAAIVGVTLFFVGWAKSVVEAAPVREIVTPKTPKRPKKEKAEKEETATPTPAEEPEKPVRTPKSSFWGEEAPLWMERLILIGILAAGLLWLYIILKQPHLVRELVEWVRGVLP